MSIVDKIVNYENGELTDNEIIDLFSELVSNGMAWELQGSYGRVAKSLIDNGILSPTGKVLQYMD